jgi:glycosyltransferase involved in cell wall biosynthesis
MVPDAGRVLPAFDVFALSSRTEGTPIVLFEAIAAGVPVVATAVGGVPDVVTEREALLIPPESPPLLGEALRRAFTDDEGSRARARAASARVAELFGIEPWLDAYETVYRLVARQGLPL